MIGRGGDDAGWPWWRMARQILVFLVVAHDSNTLIKQLMRQRPQPPQATSIFSGGGEVNRGEDLRSDGYGQDRVARMGGNGIATSAYSRRMRDATRDLREGGEEICGNDWRKRNGVIKATVGSLMREYWAGGEGRKLGKKGVGLSGDQRVGACERWLRTRLGMMEGGSLHFSLSTLPCVSLLGLFRGVLVSSDVAFKMV